MLSIPYHTSNFSCNSGVTILQNLCLCATGCAASPHMSHIQSTGTTKTQIIVASCHIHTKYSHPGVNRIWSFQKIVTKVGICRKFHIPSYPTYFIIPHILHPKNACFVQLELYYFPCFFPAFGVDRQTGRPRTVPSGIFEGLRSATLQVWLQHPLHNGNLARKPSSS